MKRPTGKGISSVWSSAYALASRVWPSGPRLSRGFPGETDRDFQELCDFVSQIPFDHLGVFTYADEDGTAAFDPDGRVSARRGSLRRNKAGVGSRVEVLLKDQTPIPTCSSSAGSPLRLRRSTAAF